MLLFIPSKWLYRVLQRIRVFQVTDIFQLLSLLGTLGKNIAEEIDCFHSNIHVLIIDAITLFISPLLGGRQFRGKYSGTSNKGLSIKDTIHKTSIIILRTRFLGPNYTFNVKLTSEKRKPPY